MKAKYKLLDGTRRSELKNCKVHELASSWVLAGVIRVKQEVGRWW